MNKEELLKKIDFEKSWLYDCGIFGSDVDIAFHTIKNSVIKALEQPKWIPVSERLPEDRKEKLVYLSSNRITIAKYSSRIIPLAPYKSMGWGYESRYHFIDFETEEVIAWMPLPVEPYKLESEGKDDTRTVNRDSRKVE